MIQDRPKIVYVLPEFDPNTDSHFFHIYELLENPSGLDVFTIILRANDSSPIPFPHRVLGLPRAFRMFELLLLLGRARAAGRRQFYVHYSFSGALAAWIVARFFGGVVYYWNAGMPWLYRRSRLEETIFRFILRRTILVTGTAALKEEYRRRYRLDASRIRIMPNWVAVERFRGRDRAAARAHLGIPPDVPVMLFVHRLSRRKGADRISQIAAGVTKSARNAMFLIVGDGPERERLESEIRNAGLQERVRLIGEVPHRGVPEYFAAADIFFMPSEEEGFPHVLLEAMAAGLPYVASDVGGVREITPPVLASYIIPPRDISKFSERVLDLLSLTPNERTVIQEAERIWVERYDIAGARARFGALFQ